MLRNKILLIYKLFVYRSDRKKSGSMVGLVNLIVMIWQMNRATKSN